MNVSIWRLADDPQAYGHQAGWYVIVTPDGATELTRAFEYRESAEAYAFGRGWNVVPLTEGVSNAGGDLPCM